MHLNLTRLPVLGVVRAQARRRDTDVLLVGGAVRDLLIGRAPHDLDFAVRRGPIDLARDVANALNAAFYIMDHARQTARVIARASGAAWVLDFALCRGETWEDDLRARDFTLNAIAADMRDGTVIDPLGGRRDLADGVLRLAGPSAIDDDPVRALRAVRMSVAFGVALTPETAAAVRGAADALGRPSPERLRDELMAMLAGPDAAAAAERLRALGLLVPLMPEIAGNAPEALGLVAAVQRLCAALGRAHVGGPLRAHLSRQTVDDRSRVATLVLAALLSPAGEAAAAGRAQALRLSAAEARDVRAIVLGGRAAAALGAEPGPRAVHGFMREAGSCAPESALLFAAARETDETAQALALRLIETYFSRYAPEVLPPPLLSGDDVLALGVPRGPGVGRVLEAVRAAQMIGEIAETPEALALARRLTDAGA